MSFDRNANIVVAFTAPSPDGTSDVELVSYTMAGELLWDTHVAGPLGTFENANTVRIDPHGDIFVAGGHAVFSSSSYYDGLLLRFDRNGELRWMSREPRGDESSSWFRTLVLAPDGGFTVKVPSYSAATRGDLVLRHYGPPSPPCATEPCPGDLNADCVTNILDLVTLLAHFGTTEAVGSAPANGDLDFDADVDLSDLTHFLASFGADCR